MEREILFRGKRTGNGERIFEGDIVKSFDISGELEGIGAVNLNDLFCCWQFGEKNMYGGLVGCYEVIGNIHDNSELLNGKES